MGQKLFIGILTAVLSTVFLGTLGLSVTGMQKDHDLELRVVQIEQFIKNQDRLNIKLTDLLESGVFRGATGQRVPEGRQGEQGERGGLQ